MAVSDTSWPGPVRSAADPALPVERFFELALLGMVASGFLAVAGSGHLDLPTAILGSAGLSLRLLMVSGLLRFAISSRIAAGLSLAYVAFLPVDYALISRDFLTATVHMVVFLAVLKILTAHSTRDHMFVILIAFLELLAASILSSSFGFFFFLALFLFFGVATFATGEIRRSIRKPRNLSRAGLRWLQWRLAASSGLIALGILVLTAGMFFLLPRTARAAFRHLVPQQFHVPGFSNEMRLGEMGEIQQRRTPVMHVRTEAFRNAPALPLKWRGNALSSFDGRRWSNPADAGELVAVRSGMVQLVGNRQRWRQGRRIAYQVRLNSLAADALFFAGTPEFIEFALPSAILLRNMNGGYRMGYGSTEGLRYDAISYLEESSLPDDPFAEELTEPERIRNLLLPQVDPRLMELARDLTRDAVTAQDKARAIENYLRRNFRYTTRLLPNPVPDPLVHFLLVRRQGHCEYFASAMTVMLRLVNVPARVATGFQGGTFNPVSGWYVLRASDAHAWVEAWQPGRGWVTYDPTPPSLDRAGFSLFARLGMYVDAAETFWNEWVLSYDLDRQLTLASQVENSGRTFSARWFERLTRQVLGWKDSALDAARRYGLAALLAVAAGLAAWFWSPHLLRWWRTRRRVREAARGTARASDATLLYERMLAALRRRGFVKPAWTTPGEFARQLGDSPPAPVVREFTSAYHDLRYGGRAAAAGRMVALLAELERA